LKEYTFSDELFLPHPREDVFSFFSEARNLELITPPWVRFQVLTPTPVVMSKGTLIDYRIRIHGVPVRWRTEIALWEPPCSFVDVQLSGPYRLWHHTHSFEERDGGTFCADHVRYHPFGGALVNHLFVRRDVERIFQYRRERLLEIFPRADCSLTDSPSALPREPSVPSSRYRASE